MCDNTELTEKADFFLICAIIWKLGLLPELRNSDFFSNINSQSLKFVY